LLYNTSAWRSRACQSQMSRAHVHTDGVSA